MRMRASVALLFPLAVVLVAGVVAAAGAPVLAQTAAARPPDWDQITDQTLAGVKAQYGLTDDQVRQIRPLLRAHLPKLRAVFENYAGSNVDAAPALLKQYQETRAAFKASVDPILTEAQRKDFMAIRAEFDREMKSAIIDARVQWFERVVGVDAAQSAKIRPIETENFDKRLQIFSNSPDAKGSAEVQKSLRIALQNLQGETDARLKAVLTPEQMGKYQDSSSAAAAAEAKPRS